jgi:hypothetical protein
MGIIQTIETAQQPTINRAALGEFFKLARCLTLARGDLPMADSLARNSRATDRILTITKAAVAAGSTSTWSDLLDYQVLSEVFSQSLRNPQSGSGHFSKAKSNCGPASSRKPASRLWTDARQKTAATTRSQPAAA